MNSVQRVGLGSALIAALCCAACGADGDSGSGAGSSAAADTAGVTAGTSAGTATSTAGSTTASSSTTAGTTTTSDTTTAGSSSVATTTGSAGQDDSAVDAGSAVAGDAATEEADSDETSVGVSTATFVVTTGPQGGRYTPRNVGAIWIEDSSGAYVASLEVWASRYKRDLRQYLSALGSDDDTDAVTSASLNSHVTHTAVWTLTDSGGAAVLPGVYTLWIEVSEGGTGETYSLDFDTSAGPQVLALEDNAYYSDLALTLE